MQEGSIAGWLDTLDSKKKIIKDKEKRCDSLEAENGALITKNVDLTKRIKQLELDYADATTQLGGAKGEILGLKRMQESLNNQKVDLEKQLKEKQNKEKWKDERISGLVKELADSEVALNEKETHIGEARQKLSRELKSNDQLQKEKLSLAT